MKTTVSQKYKNLVLVLISRSVTFHGCGRMGILCLSEAVSQHSNPLGEMTWLRERGSFFYYIFFLLYIVLVLSFTESHSFFLYIISFFVFLCFFIGLFFYIFCLFEEG
jgi:hypothetical protein